MNAMQAIVELDILDNKIVSLNYAITNMESIKDFRPQVFYLRQIQTELQGKRNQLQKKLLDLEVK